MLTTRSLVYNFCTTSRPSAAAKGKAATGANFAGEELYYCLQNFLQKHISGLHKVRNAHASPWSCILFLPCLASGARRDILAYFLHIIHALGFASFTIRAMAMARAVASCVLFRALCRALFVRSVTFRSELNIIIIYIRVRKPAWTIRC